MNECIKSDDLFRETGDRDERRKQLHFVVSRSDTVAKVDSCSCRREERRKRGMRRGKETEEVIMDISP